MTSGPFDLQRIAEERAQSLFALYHAHMRALNIGLRREPVESGYRIRLCCDRHPADVHTMPAEPFDVVACINGINGFILRHQECGGNASPAPVRNPPMPLPRSARLWAHPGPPPVG